MGLFEQLEDAVAPAAAATGPSVVGIRGRGGHGSGFVVADGRVVTNAHNVHGRETEVVFADGRRESGSVAGIDVDADLAVVSVDTGDAAPARWGDGATLRLGAGVVALARPRGGLRATAGAVAAVGQEFRSQRGRLVTGAVEHTAPMARGSSGGPIVDRDGAVVGVNTNRTGDGFYQAVPVTEELTGRIEALARGESPEPVRLGVAITPSRMARRMREAVGLPPRDGLLVAGVEDDGPAARAGVRRGDLIVAAGGRPVADADELHAALEALADGGTLALTVVRGVDEVELHAGGDGPERVGTA
jgi:serine protease Do